MRGPACLPRSASLVTRGASWERWKPLSISHRPISSYLQRIVGAFTGGTRNKNPLLENHRFLYPIDGGSGADGDGVDDLARETAKLTSSSLARNLDFSFVHSRNRLRFLKDAARANRATRKDQMRDLLRRVEEGGIQGGEPSEFSSHDRLLRILQEWNLVEAPGAALHSVAAWMHLLDINDAAALDGEEEDSEDEEVVDLTDKLLQAIQQNYYAIINDSAQSHPKSTASSDELQRALSCLVRQHRDQTGFGLHPDERRGQYRELLKQQRALERQLGVMVEAYQGTSTSPDMKRMVSSMYGYLHLKRQQAELLGYDSLLSQVFDKDGSGMATASLDQVRALQGAVAQRLEPHLRQLAQRHEISSAATSGYLSPSGNNNPGGATAVRRPSAQSQSAENGRPVRPMRWEKHVTLDGALQFATRIALDLFGLSIVEEQRAAEFKDRVWDASVRLFHVHHAATSQYLGSFYLDALARPSKAPRSFTTVLYAPAAASSSVLDLSISSTPRTSPIVVGLSLNVEPPAWDTDPVRLRWDDILSLLHELGHVLDIFLLLHSPRERMSLGTIAGHASLPFHRSEVLPKFMEHWMTDLPSMHALLALSETTTPFSDDEIEASVRQHSSMKLQELAQLVFYGELELRLFSSGLNLKQDSILALQRELAHKHIPHDVPDSQSNVLAPLVDVLQDAMSGRPVSSYRYVLGDVVSTNLFRNLQRQHEQTGGDESSALNLNGLEALIRTLCDATTPISDDLLDPAALWELYGIGKMSDL